jgi:arylsulfatase A-like enzyme
VVLVMADQLRADFTRAAGFPLDTMPFLDGLGAGGARFERAYTPMPICAPARISLFTGRYPKAHRVRQNGAIRHAVYQQDLVSLLRERGYAIGLSGKNHSHLRPADFDFCSAYNHQGQAPQGAGEGTVAPRPPAETAFDEWLTVLARERGALSLEPTPFPLECQLPQRIVRDALGWIDGRPADDPFFLWLSFPEPHNPYQVPEPYFSLFPPEEVPARVAGPDDLQKMDGPLGEKWRWERRLLECANPGYDDHWRRYRADYCGMLRLLDDQLRRFVRHLQARGLAENTLLLFTADHGDYAGDFGLQRKGVGLPECLIRVPLVVHGPGVVPQGPQGANTTDHVSLVDLLPTLCEALGLETPYGVQGRSLWPLLTSQKGAAPPTGGEFRSAYVELGYGGLHYGEHEHPELHFPYGAPRFDELNTVTQSGTVKALRMGRWKLTFDMLGYGQLFDLEEDPAELHNRFQDLAYRTVRQDLVEELLRWTVRAEDDLPLASYVPKRAPRGWLSTEGGLPVRP